MHTDIKVSQVINEKQITIHRLTPWL